MMYALFWGRISCAQFPVCAKLLLCFFPTSPYRFHYFHLMCISLHLLKSNVHFTIPNLDILPKYFLRTISEIVMASIPYVSDHDVRIVIF